MAYSYTLEVPEGAPRWLAIGWLLLALGSLVMGGVLTILIVLSRTPGIQEIVPWLDFFHTAIVVHVDLTIVVWLLAYAGVLWSLGGSTRGITLGWAALVLSVTGTVILALSPFFAGTASMNNYIPVLQNTPFFTGLILFGLGYTLLVLRGLAFSRSCVNMLNSDDEVLAFGAYTALPAAAAAILVLVASCITLSDTLTGPAYYERLFWGSGHLLQFAHVQLMLVAWLWLAALSGAAIPFSSRATLLLLGLGVTPVLATPAIYYFHDVNSPEYVTAFTRLMEYGGGLAALPLTFALVAGMIHARGAGSHGPERFALIFSIGLFSLGGVIGFLISGSNVTIPAHYHGSTVAVTLAFMGVTYSLLPRLGFKMPSLRLARLQLAIYGSGQLLHILGLAWSGGYGIQRKTAGAAQGLHHLQETAGMAVMGLGGTIAVAGGFLFLVIAIKAMWPVILQLRAYRPLLP